jgi:hypothetical protein
MRLLRDPFIQFLLIGGLVFLVYRLAQPAIEPAIDKQISIDAATQQWLHSNFAKQFRRPPTRLEMGTLIRRYTTNEVKYREALAMGLDQRDSIVLRRMMQKFDFLFGNGAATANPSDQELEDWYAANGDEFRLPATVTLQHLWFTPDARGDAAKDDATAALNQIEDRNLDPADVAKLGDRFPFQSKFDDATFAEVRNVLGEEFARAVFAPNVANADNGWTGPIQSGLGYHLVQVQARTKGAQPPLDQVREEVLAKWREQESERMLSDMIARLQGEYNVELDEEAITQLPYTPETESVQIGFGADD